MGKEFTTAFKAVEAESEAEEQFVEFTLDGREMRAYQPTEGQLVFMLASMGRGQSNEGRFASMINILMSSLREEDRDYLESRLLSRDPKQRIDPEVIGSIFEYCTEEWFGRPTKPQSDSATSPTSDGQN